MNARFTKSVRFLGFLLIVFGVAFVPDRAIGQVTNLEKTLVSLGFKVQQNAVVDATPWERSEFNLHGKRRYGIKSLKPVAGERTLYYRFTVEVEAYQNGSDAQKRLDRIIATPPSAITWLEGETTNEQNYE